ncbi:histidine phosphatase family protein [Bacillus alkalicellulosilyticus]|uniref:histidine phosphatase family protein n=1 Tax=Alkalihalobacterium alkalicellulosilyticum TaxID=1912214 RepID=UPI0009982973|nr:histidine phosphatase family protein [Bacillus alkalicellulosilyticus]
MRLYLVRHGESLGNVQGIIQGQADFPLSPLGQIQVQQLGKHFQSIPFDYIYSSDLTRAQETAQAIASNREKTIHPWEKVREIFLGPLQGKTQQEIFTEYPELEDRALLTSGIAGTETVEDITSRCAYVWDQMTKAHQDNDVVIVSHGGFISIFIMYLMLGNDWHLHHRPFHIGNTGITLIEAKAGRKPVFHYINDTSHIRTEEQIS